MFKSFTVTPCDSGYVCTANVDSPYGAHLLVVLDTGITVESRRF